MDKVMTRGGITFQGLTAMEERGFTEAIMAGLEKAKNALDRT
jgi:pyrroline-5-carboxylate reductase